MKVVLFCGGFGTRLREYSEQVPKPLVPIGYQPIIWHLMKYYAHYGHREFVLCLGYRGDMLKQYFLDYDDRMSCDFELNPGTGASTILSEGMADWRIVFRDTGLHNNIGQRLMAVKQDVVNDGMFLANYSDALTDLDLEAMIAHFRSSNAVGAFVATRPALSFSGVEFGDDGIVTGIDYLQNSTFVNGGFFVFRPEIFDFIEEGDELVEAPFARLIEARKLMCYRFEGFWCAMDTYKDKKRFDSMFESGDRPWEVWTA